MNINDEDILSVYVGQFAARHDAFVKDSSVHINEALTGAVIEAAFREGFSVSGYMSDTDTTHVGAIDFDAEDGLEQAREVRALLVSHHIPSLLVGSRRGAHLWVTTDPVKGSVIRKALKAAVGLAGVDGPKVEIFPKQSRSTWGCGALRMPLMRHPKTGVRYPAYGPGDEPIERISDMLMAFDSAPVDALRAIVGPGPAHSPISTPTGPYRVARASTGDEPSASALLASLGLHAQPGHSVRCPFHDDRHASLSISDDDQRVWCKSPTCPIHNDGTGLGSLRLEALIRKGPPVDRPSDPDPDGVPGGVPAG